MLLQNGNLLSMSKETMLANVQYLTGQGLGYRRNPYLLSSTPARKRAKEAWLLRNVFTDGDFRDRVDYMRLFLHETLHVLSCSLTRLEECKPQYLAMAREMMGVQAPGPA
jgi:hypothetical protein